MLVKQRVPINMGQLGRRSGVRFNVIRKVGALALVSTFAISCGDAFPASPSGSTTAPTTDALAFCVTETNRYRALVNSPPVARSSALEAHAALAAAADAASGRAHGYFVDSRAGNGLVAAENEFFDGSQFPTQAVMQRGLANFWSEGPAGGHYQTMASSALTQVGCGFATVASGTMLVQDFR
jgi:uncharacterized protein YkwD